MYLQETPRIGVAIGDLILDLKKSTKIFNGILLKDKTDVFQQVSTPRYYNSNILEKSEIKIMYEKKLF